MEIILTTKIEVVCDKDCGTIVYEEDFEGSDFVALKERIKELYEEYRNKECQICG